MTPTITISPIENDFVENTPSPRPGVAFNSYPIAKSPLRDYLLRFTIF